MPRTYTRTFRVRHYECDAYGHLNHAHYARYMQETAFDASAEAGYDLVQYAAMQRLWLIRETQIEFLQPLEYNAAVHVHTYVADVHRVTSKRNYEFHLADGTLAARGWTNWVFMDTAANRPARIPPEVGLAFFPEGVPADQPTLPPYPTPPDPPPGAFHMNRRVSWRDLDRLQHVNNAVYLDYASDCSFETIAAFHWPWERLAQAGLGIFIRRLHAQYLQPALYGDELEITSWAYNVMRAMANRHYTIRRAADQALLAQVNTLGVWVSRKTGQPMRIPPEMLADFAPNIVKNGG